MSSNLKQRAHTEVKPRLTLNYTADGEHLNVKIKFNVVAPIGDRFMPEKMILQYAENNQSTFKFVNRYCKRFSIKVFLVWSPQNAVYTFWQ